MDDIVLKDRDGKDITYPGINSIRLKTADGGTREFLHGETAEKTVAPDFSVGDMEIPADGGTFLTKVTIEKPKDLSPENIRKGKEIAGVTGDFIGDTESVTVELALADGDQTVSPSADGKVISGVTIKKPETLNPANIAKGVEVAGVTGSLEVPETVETSVELDFSGGDMVVTPEDGQAFSAVNIPVPGTLIPENIAEGVNIAGIIGTLAAGGGEIVSSYKYTTPTNKTAFSVEHGLGVVPDIVVAYAVASSFTATYYFLSAGKSNAALSAGIKFPTNDGFYRSSNAIKQYSKVSGIDDTDYTTNPIHSANEKTVTFYNLSTSYAYNFYFIGGLT